MSWNFKYTLRNAFLYNMLIACLHSFFATMKHWNANEKTPKLCSKQTACLQTQMRMYYVDYIPCQLCAPHLNNIFTSDNDDTLIFMIWMSECSIGIQMNISPFFRSEPSSCQAPATVGAAAFHLADRCVQTTRRFVCSKRK